MSPGCQPSSGSKPPRWQRPPQSTQVMCRGTSTSRTVVVRSGRSERPGSVRAMRIVAGTAGGQEPGGARGCRRPARPRTGSERRSSTRCNSYGLGRGLHLPRPVRGLRARSGSKRCRGAPAACTFVDVRSSQHRDRAPERRERSASPTEAVIRQADGPALAASAGPHDVALLDPPVRLRRPGTTCCRPFRCDVVVIESDRAIAPGARWQILKEKRYAGSVVVIARTGTQHLHPGRPGGPQRMTRAMYPGSFDPVHVGHVDVVEAVAPLFDDVVVVAMYNPDKMGGFFSLDQREDAACRVVRAPAQRQDRQCGPGLVVHAARELGADVIVKGIRSATDLDVEMQMAQTNKARQRCADDVRARVNPTTRTCPAASSVRSRRPRRGRVDAMVPAPRRRRPLPTRGRKHERRACE